MTGQSTRPPTTLASAPSIPATTMMTFAFCRTGVCESNLWIPATPTSQMSCVFWPRTSAVTFASAATGMAAVPAVTTAM